VLLGISKPSCRFVGLLGGLIATAAPSLGVDFTDFTRDAGLPPLDVSRVQSVDLNGDGYADLITRANGNANHAPRVFLASTSGLFAELTPSPLPELNARDVITFADLNNDGHADAIVARYLDYLQPDFHPPSTGPRRSAILLGHGEGTFAEPQIIAAAPPATTAAIAVHDVNRDGLPDLWLGNWYERYFSGYEAFANDLLLQYPQFTDTVSFVRWSAPQESDPLDGATDSGGRPTYGVAIAHLDESPLPHLLELNYGRRWNRLYALSGPVPHPGKIVTREAGDPLPAPRPAGPLDYRSFELTRTLYGTDIAPAAGFDGDEIRHGRHPQWLQERAKDDPRFKRDDEPPFRANGNTFDAAIGDIDNDGDFDVFVSTIMHNWAGDSSDRSRFLVNRLRESGQLVFDSPAALSVDRVPAVETPDNRNHNQGDIFCELADFNNDGRLDLVLCSSDYSDPPPHDERLRIYLQQADGTFTDHSTALGLDHQGAGQPTLLDYDHDGDLDLVVGQTFNRLTADRRREASLANGTLTADSPAAARGHPVLRLYRNDLAKPATGVVIRLIGDPAAHSSRDAYGTLARATLDHDRNPATPDLILTRQLNGPGGHAGKRSDTLLHFGLGEAPHLKSLELTWPNGTKTLHHNLAPGIHLIDQAHSAISDKL
jgi:hypothetical protein